MEQSQCKRHTSSFFWHSETLCIWTEHQKEVTWYNELSSPGFFFFGWIYIKRIQKYSPNPQCMFQTTVHNTLGGGGVVEYRVLIFYLIAALRGDLILQTDRIAPQVQTTVLCWCSHIPRWWCMTERLSPQNADLNIIETLWEVWSHFVQTPKIWKRFLLKV